MNPLHFPLNVQSNRDKKWDKKSIYEHRKEAFNFHMRYLWWMSISCQINDISITLKLVSVSHGLVTLLKWVLICYDEQVTPDIKFPMVNQMDLYVVQNQASLNEIKFQKILSSAKLLWSDRFCICVSFKVPVLFSFWLIKV